MKDSTEILIAARSRIEAKESWCQFAFAKDAWGNITSPYLGNAVRWCGIGTLMHGRDASSVVYARLKRALDLVYGDRYVSMTDFNDDKNTSHADVLHVYDVAIEKTL